MMIDQQVITVFTQPLDECLVKTGHSMREIAFLNPVIESNKNFCHFFGLRR